VRSSAKAVAATEAASEGWLGDIDFKPDIRGIINRLSRALELKKVADELAALDNPNDDDRKILAEARTTIASLEKSAFESVELISQCASEAMRIDDSLRQEREEARTAEQRAELHGKLGAMLYGIEAAPESAATNSTADAVMARVQAYRELKNQIQTVREA